ncbi:MAG: TRAM domain-containing protein [Chloroflexi bacterium]|nr:TRAM domain-containing protein [Chloroflexota bacterium]
MLIAFVRIIGGVILGFVGWQAGGDASAMLAVPHEYTMIVSAGLGAVGVLGGVLAVPPLIIYPLRHLSESAIRVPTDDLVAGGLGLLMASVISALLAVPLSRLPSYLGNVTPFFAAVALAYMGVRIMLARHRDLGGAFHIPWRDSHGDDTSHHGLLLDTSAIIDGRIADISVTGFLPGTLFVPRFVLEELQHIADSPDSQRRNRGRRGLEMLNRLQRESLAPVKITDHDIEGPNGVDTKLVKLARQMRWSIVTSDFNLNRVASLQGVRALNVNELANAIRVVFLPGEELIVRIAQEGKEAGQGVGYLDDGTMVVVEDGRRHVGSEVEVVVTRVLQTAAGRMIFARLRGAQAEAR